MKIREKLILFTAAFMFIGSGIAIVISFYNQRRDNYASSINFVVKKKKVYPNGICDLYDKNNIEFSTIYFFREMQVYEGDSIVKKANSNRIYVFRKKNWRDYGPDDDYFIAEEIDLR